MRCGSAIDMADTGTLDPALEHVKRAFQPPAPPLDPETGTNPGWHEA